MCMNSGGGPTLLLEGSIEPASSKKLIISYLLTSSEIRESR